MYNPDMASFSTIFPETEPIIANLFQTLDLTIDHDNVSQEYN